MRLLRKTLFKYHVEGMLSWIAKNKLMQDKQVGKFSVKLWFCTLHLGEALYFSQFQAFWYCLHFSWQSGKCELYLLILTLFCYFLSDWYQNISEHFSLFCIYFPLLSTLEFFVFNILKIDLYFLRKNDNKNNFFFLSLPFCDNLLSKELFLKKLLRINYLLISKIYWIVK